MSNKDEALKLALDALVKALPDMPVHTDWHLEAITALREALTSVPDWASEAKEQPAQQQEPVACPDGKQCKHGSWCTETYCQEHCEFRAPPQRKPLSVEQIAELDCNDHYKFARAIEAAHGIKGDA